MTEQLHFHFSLSCTGEGNGNLLQSSCLENSVDCIVNGVAKELDITEQLSHTHVEYGSGGLKKGRTTELH